MLRRPIVLNKQKTTESEQPFMNLSIEEMSARISARDKELHRRNLLILGTFFAGLLIAFGIGAWYYGEWMLETAGALWQLGASLWHLEWWRAGQILFQYKLSFFLFGLIGGFFLFLFITFQIGELLVELLWDGITALFN